MFDPVTKWARSETDERSFNTNLLHSVMMYKHKHKRSTTTSSAKLLAIRELIDSTTL